MDEAVVLIELTALQERLSAYAARKGEPTDGDLSGDNVVRVDVRVQTFLAYLATKRRFSSLRVFLAVVEGIVAAVEENLTALEIWAQRRRERASEWTPEYKNIKFIAIPVRLIEIGRLQQHYTLGILNEKRNR